MVWSVSTHYQEKQQWTLLAVSIIQSYFHDKYYKADVQTQHEGPSVFRYVIRCSTA